MQNVILDVKQTDMVALCLNEELASYQEMMDVLKAYIDWMFTHYVSNLIFCDTLPDEGDEDILYINKEDLRAYMWDGIEYVEISASSGGGTLDIATDEEVQEMLDEVFGPTK